MTPAERAKQIVDRFRKKEGAFVNWYSECEPEALIKLIAQALTQKQFPSERQIKLAASETFDSIKGMDEHLKELWKEFGDLSLVWDSGFEWGASWLRSNSAAISREELEQIKEAL